MNSESYIPMEELIRAGEVKGWEALVWLDEHGAYAYHGSAQPIKELEPRQAMNDGAPDGDPAVCATTRIDQAIFRALINKQHDMEANRSHRSAWVGIENDMVYLAMRQLVDDIKTLNISGFVHVLPKKHFEVFRGEMRAYESLVPDFTVEVNGVDLPENIMVFDTEQSLSEYRQALMNGVRHD